MAIPFDNTYAQLPDCFFSKQPPSPVSKPVLIRANTALAAELGIDPAWMETEDALATFAGNSVPEGAEPLAQAYAGHQFGGFSPQLGDGRALLLGEVVGSHGGRRDIQLKGSGATYFSRRGDGKSALGPVLREYLVSEAMHALGVPTTRALAAVATGESVFRQEGSVPGGVFTRVAASHIRVGTFQYFLARRDTESLRTLADYVIARHYPDAADAEEPFVALLESVIGAQAKLVAHWMSLGFIHGVMNTDNIAVSGETIDFGPCAFMDAFHPSCTFSSIDTGGRYAWGNQPEITLWNLTRFAETLLPLISGDPDTATKLVTPKLDAFAETFANEYDLRFRAKFGLAPGVDPDLVANGLALLADQEVDFTVFFRFLTLVDKPALTGLFSDPAPFEEWFAAWIKTGPDAEAMRTANPVVIPRNHRIEQAIQSAYTGDFTPFHRLASALATPYEDRGEHAWLEVPPRPDEVVHATFCGT